MDLATETETASVFDISTWEFMQMDSLLGSQFEELQFAAQLLKFPFEEFHLFFYFHIKVQTIVNLNSIMLL